VNNDVNAVPKFDVKENSISRILVYSPTQVACGTIGGPVGLIYFLMCNFKALGQEERKNATLFLGFILIVVLIVAIPFLPEKIPSTPFTIAYIVIARQVAEKYQMTKADIKNSALYDFHSNWRVFGFGLLCLAASAAVIMGPLMLLILTGVWSPA